VAPGGHPTWDAILAEIRGAQRILLALHVRPDGDSVGSSLAVARCVRSLGKQAVVVCSDPLPPNLAFLDPERECLSPSAVVGPFDLGLFLDCADPGRLGTAQALLPELRCLINLDHHPSNTRYGQLNLIDCAAAACAELALRLIDDLGAAVDPWVATILYVALATDTGCFRHASTSARTLSMAARLRGAGADLDLLSAEVWGNRSLPSLRLLGLALQTLTLDSGGELAWLEVSADALAAAGAEAEAIEGLVDYPRKLRGVEVAVLFAADRPGEVRVSLRSRGRVDVSALAAEFGGGGHARAAGCTLPGDLAAARALVLAAARGVLSGASRAEGRP